MLLLIMALISSAAPVTIVRKHTTGQRYRLTYTNADPQLRVSKTFKGTAVVTEVTPASTRFVVSLDELTWTNEKGQTQTAGGVKLTVDVSADSVDAELVDPGTAGDAAELELTSVEKMLGNLCQPPAVKFSTGKAVTRDGAQWTLLSVTSGVAKLSSTPRKGGSPFSCELTVSLSDGFAGERTGVLEVDPTDPKGKPLSIEQRNTLKIELIK